MIEEKEGSRPVAYSLWVLTARVPASPGDVPSLHWSTGIAGGLAALRSSTGMGLEDMPPDSAAFSSSSPGPYLIAPPQPTLYDVAT